MAMPKTNPQTGRKKRILWMSVECLLDTSSGAAIQVKEILSQLQNQDYEVLIAGATIFDALKVGVAIRESIFKAESKPGNLALYVDSAGLKHHLLMTRSVIKNDMLGIEYDALYLHYTALLDQFKPDLVFFWGGRSFDFLIADEARYRGCPSAVYLANANYGGQRWIRDVDLILTNSKENAKMYQEKHQYDAIPVGAFINSEKFVAKKHTRDHLLFINPRPEKGVTIVAQLALILEKRRPDIRIEVVESRGNWLEYLNQVAKTNGMEEQGGSNVRLTANTSDMAAVYGRARVVLAPSLWWESMGRVLAEAMLNGIPALITNRGGMPEMVGDAGLVVRFPEKYYQTPYSLIPAQEILEPLVKLVTRLWDDEAFYQDLVQKAYAIGEKQHSIEIALQKLLDGFSPLLAKNAGDIDTIKHRTQQNKLPS